MNDLEKIKEKFIEFNTYLESIDLNELRKKHTRAELKKLSEDLYSINIKSLAYEISKLVDEMKKEEFPELLGVHHFPDLREIDFLTDEKKIKLDEHLARVRVGNYLYGLRNVIKDSKKIKMVEQFLLEKGIVEDRYYVLCPVCGTGHISNELNKEQKAELEEVVKDLNHKEREETLEKYLEYICMDCEIEADIRNLTSLYFKTVYKMKKERDGSLDHV
jgi:peptide subunit release factor 1 (eRF1)